MELPRCSIEQREAAAQVRCGLSFVVVCRARCKLIDGLYHISTAVRFTLSFLVSIMVSVIRKHRVVVADAGYNTTWHLTDFGGV